MIAELRKEWSQNIERYEAKFTIPYDLIDPISDFVSVYCRLDQYSEDTDDGFYKVNNLYFDSPNYLLLKRRLDVCENRFNLRIRSYGNRPALPYFFEVKQKRVNVIRKYRSAIDEDGWERLFDAPFRAAEEIDAGGSNRNLFLRLVHSYAATPKVLTQYRRKAYVSEIDAYARVTFDINLRYQSEQGYTVIPDEDTMISLDNPTIFDPDCNVVLELKCNTTLVPLWMVDLIRQFGLHRTSFSKYVTGVVEVLNLYHYHRESRVAHVRGRRLMGDRA